MVDVVHGGASPDLDAHGPMPEAKSVLVREYPEEGNPGVPGQYEGVYPLGQDLSQEPHHVGAPTRA